ncbi:SixA phosphatase family protein, partial [Roseivirga sp. UBA1976]
MKRLLIVRHAKSSWDFPELSDFERPLNHRGEKDVPDMATRIKKLGLKPELMISSPANRAITTA